MSSVIPAVFIDTNVWFSAFWGSKNCEKLIRAHVEGLIIAVVSQQVLEESIRNIKQKIPQVLSVWQELIASYPPKLIADPESVDSGIKKLVKAEDQLIFTAAIRGKVNYFVTGNLKDFQAVKLERASGIKILNPAQAIKLLCLR